MKAKKVLFGNEAIQAIKKGLDLTADAVKATIGPKGKNCFIDREMTPEMTNDGIKVAMSVTLKDHYENMGAWLVKNTSSQTNEEAGDGTTTTAVLLQSIVNESLQRPENPMDIRNSLLETGKKIEGWIKEATREVKDGDMKDVATISSESESIGALISEIILKVGKDTPIRLDTNPIPEITYEVVNGLETKVGYANPVWVTNPERQTAEYLDVPVVAVDRRISSLMDLKPVLDSLGKAQVSSWVLLTSDIDTTLLSLIAASKTAPGGLDCMVIVVRGTELEDMASVSGATMFSETLKLKDFKLEHLGRAKKLIANDKKTIIEGTNSEIQKNAVIALQARAENTKNFYEKEQLTKRSQALKGGIAVIKVGSPTDTERGYLIDKIEDAINATKSALEEGLVEGGGMCLYRISNRIKGNSPGEEILRKALRSPLKAIIENAGKDYTEVIKKLSTKKGYDAKNDKNVDMFKLGIVDPAKVTRCAFVNALSTAATFITSGVAVTDLEEVKK